jgi:pimeloyl-ACP methyl ester carboxylesterase
MDMEGYGRSARPPVMDNPCNAPAATKAQLPAAATAACGPAVFGPITTMASDWNDIGTVVDRVLVMRGVSKLSIVAWSQGGPRSFGYTLANPGKVDRLAVLLTA